MYQCYFGHFIYIYRKCTDGSNMWCYKFHILTLYCFQIQVMIQYDDIVVKPEFIFFGQVDWVLTF